MRYRKSGSILGAVVVLLLCSAVRAQVSDETSVLRDLARNFFETFQEKDLEKLVNLWSAKSPELSTFTSSTKQRFAETGTIQLKDLDVRRVTVEGAESVVRVTVEMHATDLKSGQPATGFGQVNRSLRFVKEEGQWKLWRYGSTEEELASLLISTTTEKDRLALLETERELQTVELLRALRTRVENSIRQRDLTQAFAGAEITELIAQKIGDEPALAFAINIKGVIHHARGEYPQAVEMFQKHLSLSVTANDKAMTARTLHNIGTVKRFQADYTGALEWLRRSLEVAETLGDKRILSGVLNTTGVVHREQGNYAQALAFLERSLALSEAINDPAATSSILNNIGTIHGSQGNHRQALEYFERTLKLGRAAGDKTMIANSLNNIGISHYSQRHFARALDYYSQSLALREELNDRRMAALTLNNIGIIHREQGDHEKALDYYRKSLELRETLDDQAGTATVLNHIGIIHLLQGDALQSLQISGRVLEIANRLASPELLWRGYELAGRAHVALKQYDEAEKAFTNSINTIEQMRHRVGGSELARQRFFEDKLQPYMAMIELAFERNRPIDVLTYAELAKARTLLDVIRNGRVHITKAMTPEQKEMERFSNAQLNLLNTQIYEESQRLKPDRERIAELEPRREKARLAHEAFLTSLYVKHPELKVQRGETTPITLAEAADMLPGAATALLEFVVAEEKSYLILLSRDSQKSPVQVTLYPLNVTSKQLSEEIEEFRRMLAERDLTYQTKARQLYDLLLKPAEDRLRRIKTLCIVPDRALCELPFQALQPRTGVHLIEDLTLFYAPSLTVLRESLKRRTPLAEVARGSKRRATFLGVANPELGKLEMVNASGTRERLSPLPEAENEVKTVALLYGTPNSRIFIGADARESKVKTEATKYKILHFATHGLLDDLSPMYSNKRLKM
jgi:tetratricopeptide (TPR) repeat protein